MKFQFQGRRRHHRILSFWAGTPAIRVASGETSHHVFMITDNVGRRLRPVNLWIGLEIGVVSRGCSRWSVSRLT